MKRGETILGWFVILAVWIGCMVSLTSCSRRAIGTTETSETVDSVRIEYIPREVIVTLPGDTVEIIKVIECDPVTNKPKPFQLSKKATKAKIQVKVDAKGQLTASGSCDSLKHVITALDKEVFHLRKEKKNKVEVVPFYKTRKIDVICRCFTGAWVIAFIIYIIVKIKGGWLSGVIGFVKGLFRV